MKPTLTRTALLGLALAISSPAYSKNVAAPEQAATAQTAEKPKEQTKDSSATEDPELAAKQKEQQALATENKLQAERLTHETNPMRAEITRLKMERELLTEKMALEAAQTKAAVAEELAKLESDKERLTKESEIAKIRAEKLSNDLKAVQSESAMEITRLQNEINHIETSLKRKSYANSEPVYLENPLLEDGTLVISDRRIPLNGLITPSTADFVTSRIQYWNNQNSELPIFIVIDSSPGGSVMAGYRILKSMEASSAPIHVVVKSFAASMAAGITTLATESYAYPNAVLLHHQISSTSRGQLNLTQQREFHQESQRWWKRLATPIAEKMGISTDEFIDRMYERHTSGDWSEFATEAQKLKWVNHIVEGISETSVIKNPDAVPAAAPQTPPTPPRPASELQEQIDDDGTPFMWLPRLEPMDVYFLYNPDNYYRLR